jgi:lipoic acid synthetase
MTALPIVVGEDAGVDGKPGWLAAKAPSSERTARVRTALQGLVTVCESARCPNQGACWAEGTATVMAMGEVCTRGCGFCAVPKGRPAPVDVDEPGRIAHFARALDLRYVVLTCVARDDLHDGGAGHLAACVRALRAVDVQVEVLVPAFADDAVDVLVDAGPVVVAHNIETVARLQRGVRDVRASWGSSLGMLARMKRAHPRLLTKSSVMLGLGETDDDVLDALIALRAIDVDVVTLGQYLRPTPRHLPVARWVSPALFDAFAADAHALGFRAVASGALVRSSFRAAALAAQAARTRARVP